MSENNQEYKYEIGDQVKILTGLYAGRIGSVKTRTVRMGVRCYGVKVTMLSPRGAMVLQPEINEDDLAAR